MHIGIDCRLPHYQMGGISRYTIQLIQALAEIDPENRYTIFHSRKDGRSYQPSAANFQRKNLVTPCHHRLERRVLAAELLPHRLDVLHSPDFIPPAAGAKRFIITIHDLNFIFYPEFLTADSLRYYRDQIVWAAARADHIVADSQATRRDVIERLSVPPEKITTIPLAANPLYERPFSPADIDDTLQQYNLPRGFVLVVGTLEPRKNLPMLIRAYQQMLAETAVDAPLILVGGKGWIYDDIFAAIDELGLRGQVRHLEGVYDAQLAHLYHAAGVLVTPSKYEGFGLPALEAMHCDCPVIVSDCGSLPEVAGGAGILLNPDDESAWAEAMARVLTDSDLRQTMIVNGRSQAAAFTWEKTARATLSLYTDSPRSENE
ncbi:MAG: glycosyltransferase family 1 protein [Chloroflexota bacterium]